MIFLVHLKRFVFWSIITFLFGFIVSLAYLFSNTLTLNTVKINEFKIYYSFLNKIDNFNSTEILSHFEILLSPKKYPLLPIALISEKECIENILPYYETSFNLSICKKISFDTLKNNKLLTEVYYENEIISNNSENYIYKKLQDRDIWLLAKIDNYYKFNDTYRFIKYISDEKEGLSWITSVNSFKTFLQKSRFIWTVIIPFSILLFIIYTLYYLIQTNKLSKLMKEKDKYLFEWNKLNIKTKELTQRQFELENKLKDSENSTIDEIKNLEDENQKLSDDIYTYMERLKIVEELEKDISNQLNKASKNLTFDEKEKILDQSLDKLEQIDLLWKYQPSWKERHEIENKVSLRDSFTPFTISQAFICFEKIVEKLVTKIDSEYSKKNLMEQINIIFDNNLLPEDFRNDLHLIRKARNQWFHSGKEPKKEVYTILLDILDKTETQPLL